MISWVKRVPNCSFNRKGNMPIYCPTSGVCSMLSRSTPPPSQGKFQSRVRQFFIDLALNQRWPIRYAAKNALRCTPWIKNTPSALRYFFLQPSSITNGQKRQILFLTVIRICGAPALNKNRNLSGRSHIWLSKLGSCIGYWILNLSLCWIQAFLRRGGRMIRKWRICGTGGSGKNLQMMMIALEYLLRTPATWSSVYILTGSTLREPQTLVNITLLAQSPWSS